MNDKIDDKSRRIDPIFGLQTPLLFAHRGGAKEAPESTKKAFKYAIDSKKVDVLELDVQLTKDRKIVVWHGPSLNKVKISGQTSSKIKRFLKHKSNIWHYNFKELKGQTWVADPKKKKEKKIANIPEVDNNRQLILLEDFFDWLDEKDSEKKFPLNIELKGQKIPIIGKSLFLEEKENEESPLKKFKQILDVRGEGRKTIVASASKRVLIKFDEINKDPSYPTNLSFVEQMHYSQYMRPWFVRRILGPLVRIFDYLFLKERKVKLNCNAFQTSYALVRKKLVEKVYEEKGSIYIFLTGFWPIPGIVERYENKRAICKYVSKIFPIKVVANRDGNIKVLEDEIGKLKAIVDGLMTDYPKKIGDIL